MASSTSTPVPQDGLDELTVLVPPDQRTDSLSAVAYYWLRDLIVTLELSPGTTLIERDLMAQLGVGRTPVREALRRLADDGLVAIYARRGMVVAPVDVHDLARVSEVRVELEGVAARLAAQRADQHDHEAAGALLADLDRIADRAADGDLDERTLIRLDQRVHHCVHRAAHNDYLTGTLDRYLTLSLRLWFLGLDRVQRLDDAVREHRGLLSAVLAGDEVHAEATARDHVIGFWHEIRRVLTG